MNHSDSVIISTLLFFISAALERAFTRGNAANAVQTNMQTPHEYMNNS